MDWHKLRLKVGVDRLAELSKMGRVIARVAWAVVEGSEATIALRPSHSFWCFSSTRFGMNLLGSRGAEGQLQGYVWVLMPV